MAQPLSLPGTHGTTVPGNHGTTTATACQPWHHHHHCLSPMAPTSLLPGTHSSVTVTAWHPQHSCCHCLAPTVRALSSAPTVAPLLLPVPTALPLPSPPQHPQLPWCTCDGDRAPGGTAPGDPAGALSPLKVAGTVQCPGLVPLSFAAEAALPWQRHPQGNSPSVPGLEWTLQGGSSPKAGCTPTPTGTVPAPAAPSQALMPWGTADVAAAAPSPGHYLVRAAARGLFLALHHFPANAAASSPLSCHAPPRTTILARPRMCVCLHHARLPGRLCHTCQPPAGPLPALPAPSPASTAHQLTSGQLAVTPGACRAGGRAVLWRAASPSHVLLLGYPRPGGLCFGPSLPQSCQGEATERLASSDGGVCPSSCSTCPWAAPAEATPPVHLSCQPARR